MADLEILALDPVTPQIRAPGAGDGYSVPRNMTFAAGTTVTAQTANVQTLTASKTVFTDGTKNLTSTGTVGVDQGGTGQTTQQAAINALAGAVTSGQYLRGNGTDVVLAAIQAGDVPTLNQNTTGTAANVTGTVAVANGGTGQTSYTDGELLIGNSTGNTLTKATLTAGSGISVTNGSGSITIAATGGAGTVTSVSGTGTVNGITLTGTVTSSGSLTLGGTLSGVSLSTQVSGTLALGNGGTGESSQQAAINTLSGAVTSGQYLRGNGTNVVMSAIQAGDVPTLNQNTTGTAAGLSSTLAVTSGGTGQTTYTNGQLLIGNSTGNTLTKATLTAGTGITITNGAGSITVASSSSGGAQDYIVQSYGVV